MEKVYHTLWRLKLTCQLSFLLHYGVNSASIQYTRRKSLHFCPYDKPRWMFLVPKPKLSCHNLCGAKQPWCTRHLCPPFNSEKWPPLSRKLYMRTSRRSSYVSDVKSVSLPVTAGSKVSHLQLYECSVCVCVCVCCWLSRDLLFAVRLPYFITRC